jgi:hypothetical protein
MNVDGSVLADGLHRMRLLGWLPRFCICLSLRILLGGDWMNLLNLWGGGSVLALRDLGKHILSR